ncbi:hypothetical protein ACFE04_012569 [Oxalis oulophora]
MGRSHRPQSSSDHHHDDWVDGSWTVDCICGVTFDDGEEMVNCDDCGVWVHTRCSRYIKGDDLFTCDKCKGNSFNSFRRNNTSVNDSEETEVAQLLVELPTKTVRMDNGSYDRPPPQGGLPPPFRRPFRLWADIPMEERVHVQGVPGGDRSIFSGGSSVFTPDLWKCTGYVPKKFNFQYREFPCWDEKDDNEDENENENPVDKGAGVLFSLSKESVMAAPVVDLYGSNKVGGLLLPVSSKRKREELGTSKNRSGKNKFRISEKELDSKKRTGHTSKTVFTPTRDAKQPDCYEDRHTKSFKTDIHSIKGRNSSDYVSRDPLPDVSVAVENSVAKKTTISSKTLASDPWRHKKFLDTSKQSEVKGSAIIKNSSKTDSAVESLAELNNDESNPIKKEVESITDDKSVHEKGSIQNEDLAASTAPNCKDSEMRQNLNGDIHQKSEEPNTEVKNELNNDNSRERKDTNNPGIPYQQISELHDTNDAVVNGLQPNEPTKAHGADETFDEARNCFPANKADKLSEQHGEHNREVPKGSTESKHGSESPLKSDEVLSSQRKMIVCVVKSPTCSDITKAGDSGSKTNIPCGKRSNVVRDEEISRKGVKEELKLSSKAAHQSRASIDSSGSLQNHCNKTSASASLHKSEKSSSHSSSKGNHAPSMHPSVPPNPSAALSDEELALLLHQELNSSPRVPRVPRVRHSGSLPQLASPTATTILIKRTSSSGPKDHGLVPRRKGRAHEHDDAKRSDRLLPTSPDRRMRDTRRDGKKNMSPAHGPSSSAEAIDYKFRSSPRGDLSDDDTGAARGPVVHHTLPGLINEIMSKGRRMTVDELCDAVFPHWNSLRKHNGERYAYSTHSQAVLDCLRNRHEWARLVDRGPKTSSSRKRRKFDEESEDNEYTKGRNVESKSIDSEFPKGKRKARKRRRLELQGRGIKDTRRRSKDEIVTADDDNNNRPFSCSSDDDDDDDDDSIFTEDEIQQDSDSSDERKINNTKKRKMTVSDSSSRQMMMMENGGGDCLPLTPDREKLIIAGFLHNSVVEEGSLYYVLSNRWFESWRNYVGYNMDEYMYGKVLSHDSVMAAEGDRPGPIDNSHLVESVSEDDDDLDVITTMAEQQDYVLVPQKTWETFIEWYKGGPPLPRKLISDVGHNNTMVEVFPLRLKLTDTRDDSQSIIRLSRKSSTRELYEKVCALRGIKLEEACIWDYFGNQKHSELPCADQSLEEVQLQMDQDILLELLVDKQHSSLFNMDSTGNELALVLLEPSRSSMSIAGGPTISNGHSTVGKLNLYQNNLKLTDMDEGYSCAKKEEKGGLTGLNNLGNTCFMNSAIQCLVHTPPIAEYFLQDYSTEINTDNPLGMRGELVIAFGDLLRELWSSGRTTVAPRQFKGKLARFAPQFSGYNQHDSQELLAFLLDGLHEDLNRVKRKPYIEIKDVDGRPDEVVAEECWNNHKARNDSLIVDVCQGQYKSTLVCPVCSKISITFDPFMYLSLPLPSTVPRKMTVTVFYGDGTGLPLPYTVTVPKHGFVKDLILALATDCRLKTDESLLLAEVYQNEIFKFLEDPLEALNSFKDNDHIVAYRINKSAGKTKLVIVHRWQEKKVCGTPLVTCLSDEPVTGVDIEAATCRLLAPFKRAYFSNTHTDTENGNLSVDGDSLSNPCDAQLEEKEEDDLGESSSEGLSFHLYLTDQKATNFNPIQKDSVIKSEKVIYVLLEWNDKEHESYDNSYLNNLPNVHKMEFSIETREESISLFSCLDAFLTEEPLGPDDMCNHYGGLGGGHYTAYAKLSKDTSWYHFDDSHVSPVKESDIKTPAAYLLFYQRVKIEPSMADGETSQEQSSL